MIIEELHEIHQKYILSNKNYTILLSNKQNEYYFIRDIIKSSCSNLNYKAETSSLAFKIININNYEYSHKNNNGTIFKSKQDNTLYCDTVPTFDATDFPEVYNKCSLQKSEWIEFIETKETDTSKLHNLGIKLNRTASNEHYEYVFSPGIYPLTQQVWLPENTTIRGANSPNNIDALRTLSGELSDHTIFLGIDKNNTCYVPEQTYNSPKTNSLWASLGGKPLRKGFLMNNNTTLKNFIGQGCFQDGYGKGALAGGGFIELPGCATTFMDSSNKVCGMSWEIGCYTDLSSTYSNGLTNKFYTGIYGMGVHNITVDNLRLNSLVKNTQKDNGNMKPMLSNVVFWSAMAIDNSPHHDISLSNIVSLQTGADGINIHGNVYNVHGENIHIEGTGDDVYAIWSGPGPDTDETIGSWSQNQCPKSSTYIGGKNIIFNNIFAKQSLIPDSTINRGSGPYGGCIGIFGVKGDVSINNLTCCNYDKSGSGGDPTYIIKLHRTFCATYNKNTSIQVNKSQWYDFNNTNMCAPPGENQYVNDFNNKYTISAEIVGTNKISTSNQNCYIEGWGSSIKGLCTSGCIWSNFKLAT